MKNKAKETELTMDMIMKMSPETFRDIMKGQPLGFKQSLLNLLKDSILVILDKANITDEERKENEKALKDLYLCLQLIEDRYTILDILVKEALN